MLWNLFRYRIITCGRSHVYIDAFGKPFEDFPLIIETITFETAFFDLIGKHITLVLHYNNSIPQL